MTARTATLEPVAAGPPGAGLPTGLRAVRWRYWYRWRALLVGSWVASGTGVAAWAAWVYRTAPHGFVDLAVYRFGVRAWWHGHDMYGMLPRTVAGHLPFVYPPVTALLLGPLAVPSWSTAIIGTLVVSLLALVLTSYVTFRCLWPGAGRRGAVLAGAALLPAALLLEPVWDTLWYGQINIVLMALVVLDCLAPNPKWPRGLLIGVAAAIKLTPAVFLLYFLLRKDYRAAITMSVSAAALTVLGFAVSWSGSLKYWFGATGGARSISGSAFYANQTLAGALARLNLPKHEQTALWLAGSAVLLVIAAVAVRRANRLGDAALAMSVVAGLGLVVSPTSWSNHWVFVVPALLALAGRALRPACGVEATTLRPARGVEATALRGRRIRDSVGWLLALLALALVFWAAPFLAVPSGVRQFLHWTPWQQLLGNSFTITAIALLVGFAAPDVPGAARAAGRAVRVAVSQAVRRTFQRRTASVPESTAAR